MSDQAQSLRNLVRRAGLWRGSRRPPVATVSLCGARPGVGVSTLAAVVAAGLRRDGRRVTLVEAAMSGIPLAQRCQLQVNGSLDDVVAGRRTVRETLLQGPAGVSILPRRRGSDPPPEASDMQIEETLRALAGLGGQSDIVLIDAGVCPNPACLPWWCEANLVLLVTTSEPIAVMDGYAGLKQAAARGPLPPFWTVVNQSPDELAGENAIAADEVPRRIARACRKFLDCEPQQSFRIPLGEDIERSTWEFTLPQPGDSDFAVATGGLTARLAAWLDVEKTQHAA